VTIQITKKGDQPANIRVSKDDKNWEVTEGKLDDLPEDIREHVQQMLGQRLRFRTQAATPGFPVERYEYRLTPRTPATPPAAPAPPASPAFPVPPTPPTPARAGARAVVPVPVAPAPPLPQVARLHAYRVEAGGGVEGKLDTILKKLDQLESKSVEQLEREVKQLRKELDELRGKSPGERRERD
jgi:hypothetical protein